MQVAWPAHGSLAEDLILRKNVGHQLHSIVKVMSHLLSLPFHRLHLHRTAWVTLGVWLWALTAGVVNACALAPSGLAGHGAAFVQLSAVHGVEVAGALDHKKLDDGHGLRWRAGDPGHEQDAEKASCLKFCDDESSALAKSAAAPLDPGTLAMVLAPTWQPDVRASADTTWLPSHTRSGQSLPLTIRFQRLTL